MQDGMTESILAKARRMIAEGQLDDARLLLADHIESSPSSVPALRLLSETCFRMGLRDEGFALALRAFDLAPADIAFGLDCAFNLVRAGRRSDALAVADKLAAQAPPDPYHRDTLGTVFTHCEAPERALEHFAFACAAAPRVATFFYNLASVQRMLGAKREAETSLDKVIALDPLHADAFLARSALRRQTIEHNHVPELLVIQPKLKGTPTAVPIGYALAKEYEDLGQYTESFGALSAASRQHRSTLRYDAPADFSLMATLRDATDSMPSTTGVPASPPIFILGLPRSGTTLVERIVSSHPGVHSAGETNGIAAEVWRRVQRHGRPANPLAQIRQVVQTEAEAIRKSYMAALRQRFPEGVFTDKTPGNYLFAGLIAKAIPGARIICLRRDPMDACYAMFKTLFMDAYPFSNDLEELATYYAHWASLVEHWERTLGDAWLTVDYEELVQHPEAMMRRIVDHVGLPWGPEYERFHERQTPVTSASAGQVDRPIYADSIGQWRNYAEGLAPMRRRLNELGFAVS